MTGTVALPLRIGARTIACVERTLVRVPLSLADVTSGNAPKLPLLPTSAHGYLITSLPENLLAPLLGTQGELRPFVRQSYRRSFVALDQGFETYLAAFSAKTRSTLLRKLRRFTERSGGELDLRICRSASEVEEFHRHARAVSVRTYQERLLDAGLPEGQDALTEMQALAQRDAMRGWLLFLDGRPVSYLYAPADGDTLIYAHLGYDPDFADLSPGTVLQLAALRELMADRRFRFLDFTEGEGQHKRQFETGAVECVDLLLLRPTLPNLAAGHLLQLFDGGVALAKQVLGRLGLERLARFVRR